MSARSTAALLALIASVAACAQSTDDEAEEVASDEAPLLLDLLNVKTLPNNFPLPHTNGLAATHSTLGNLNFRNAFHTPQGDNGRACVTCHLADAGWSVRPDQIQGYFLLTGGKHPIFNPLDANNQNDPRAVSNNPLERAAAYSQLLKGLFRRGSTPAEATREFDIVAANDPFGWGSTTRISVWRRSMPTTNFRTHARTADGEIGPIGWDHGSATLFAQAENNIRTGQHGPPASTVPGDPVVVQEMVDYEASFVTANVFLVDVGALDACGGRGGTGALIGQQPVDAPFNLYSNWLSGSCATAKRKSVARGEVLFNTRTRANGGGTCRGCHNAQNSGSNINGTLFNIGTSDERWRTPEMPIYTLKNRVTGEEIRTTDPGRANRSGRWADINRFKTPSLRAVSSHPPYFHNGICKDLLCVVKFYEQSLGFDFNASEEQDLVNFLRAL